MSDEIETAERFIEGLLGRQLWVDERAQACQLVTKRDTAIRLDERRKVWREAEENCGFLAASEAGKSPDDRIGDGSIATANFLAEHFRLLADKEPER